MMPDKYCANCGNTTPADSLFCKTCGAQIAHARSVQAAIVQHVHPQERVSGAPIDLPTKAEQPAKDKAKDGPIMKFSTAYLDFWDKLLAPFKFWEKAPVSDSRTNTERINADSFGVGRTATASKSRLPASTRLSV